ncbi:MAG TPA: GreA/GreB family elongation factor [Longimicrobiaceae bacterium]
MITELSTRIQEQLETLGEELTERIPQQLGTEVSETRRAALVERQRALQSRVQYLERIAAGLVLVDPATLQPDRVGFGSRVEVEDVRTAERMTYTIMNGEELDLDAGEISINSPVAQALLGQPEGAVVDVVTPQRERQLRILSITTIYDVVDASGLDNEADSPQDPVSALAS